MMKRCMTREYMGVLVFLYASILPLAGGANAQDTSGTIGDGKKLPSFFPHSGKIHEISLNGVTIRVPELRDMELDDSESENTNVNETLELKRSQPVEGITYLYSFSEAGGGRISIRSPEDFALLRKRFEERTRFYAEEFPMTETKIWQNDAEALVVSYSISNGNESGYHSIRFVCYMPVKTQFCRITVNGTSSQEIEPQSVLDSLLQWSRAIAIANEDED